MSPDHSKLSQGDGDDDEDLKRQSSVQIKVFRESPVCILEQNWQDRHVLSLCLHLFTSFLSLGARFDIAVCCISSVLASLAMGPVDKLGKSTGENKGAGGFQVCVVFTLRSNMKPVAQPHLLQHGIQEGTLTSSLKCMIHGMYRWNVMSLGLYRCHMGVYIPIFLVLGFSSCWGMHSCTAMMLDNIQMS